jgi:hypothetical protein
MQPLPPETTPELQDDFEIFENILGFVPNSLLTMQRRPNMVKGFGALTKAVMDPDGAVDLGLMRLVAHFSSRATGCQYCEAHSLVAAKIHHVPQEIRPARFIPTPNVLHLILRWLPAPSQTRLMQNSLPVCNSTGRKIRSCRFSGQFACTGS